MDSTLYNGQCRDCGAPLIDCKCHKEGKMDTRTLEQVIADASSSYDMTKHGTRSQAIADAVREWMQEHEQLKALQAEPMERLRSKHEQSQAVRIKELEAEVERMRSGIDEWADKAAKHDALRERFPFLPGEEFYATVSSKRLILNVGDPIPELIIYKRTVNLVGVNGVLDTKDNTWNWDECHPTAEACKAAIPVEE